MYHKSHVNDAPNFRVSGKRPPSIRMARLSSSISPLGLFFVSGRFPRILPSRNFIPQQRAELVLVLVLVLARWKSIGVGLAARADRHQSV
jgi:hypothetical protein